jgi:hypothetical protein
MTIELTPEVEASVARAAEAQGLRPEEYASRVVEQAVKLDDKDEIARRLAVFDAAMERLGKIGRGRVPKGETFSREMIYADDWPR